MFQKLLCLPCVWFCTKSAHMFQKLSYLLCGVCLSLLSLVTLLQTVRLSTFHCVLRLPMQQQYTVLSFSSMQRHGHITNWPLNLHYGTFTLWTYLSQMHRPIALHCMHYGITLWAYLSELLVKDSHKRCFKFDGKTNNTVCSKSHDHTLPLRMCYGEVYGNIAREENGWLSCSSVSL